MRTKFVALIAVASLLLTVYAQPGRPPGRGGGPAGPGGALQMNRDMEKLFGANKAFSASMNVETKLPSGTMTVPAKFSFLEGKSRFEMDMSKVKGGAMPPQAAEQMKQMGMAEMVSIMRPDKNETYLIYPGLKSYAAVPAQVPENSEGKADLELKKTELGKETVEGHPTTKYKVSLHDDQGKEQEATVWLASDLKEFPVKMEVTNNGVPSTVVFSDVKFEKPEASQFEAPTGFQRYDNMQAMMQEAMMKRFAPPGGAAPPK